MPTLAPTHIVQTFFVLVAFGLLPTMVKAEVVTLEFAGQVTSVYNPSGSVGAMFSLGDPVTASLRYDTATPDFYYPDDPARGAYISPGWLKIDVNGFRFEKTTTVQLDVLHNSDGKEIFQVLANGQATAWPTPLPEFSYTEMLIVYWQSAPPFTLLSSDVLPTAIDLSVADMSHSFVRLPTSGPDAYEIQFKLVQVPEPGSLVLLGISLLGFLSLRLEGSGRRRQ